jgi:hypothetical protein
MGAVRLFAWSLSWRRNPLRIGYVEEGDKELVDLEVENVGQPTDGVDRIAVRRFNYALDG